MIDEVLFQKCYDAYLLKFNEVHTAMNFQLFCVMWNKRLEAAEKDTMLKLLRELKEK